MSPSALLETTLVFVLLISLVMLALSRLATLIRLFALQSLLLACIPLGVGALPGETLGLHVVTICAGTLALKTLLIPWVLLRIVRTGEIHREVEPFIGFTASVMLGALLTVGSFAVARRFPLPTAAAADLLLPVAISTLFIGLLMLVSRVTAITQVIGFLVVENGIFLFGLMLLKLTPLLVELGILLDLFVAVFIMAIVVYHIRREFDHIDTDVLEKLKDL